MGCGQQDACLSMGKCFLRIPHCTTRERSGRAAADCISPPHMALKGKPWLPRRQFLKNLRGASGFKLNKVSVVFMGIMVWSSRRELQRMLSWKGSQRIIIVPPHTHTHTRSESTVPQGALRHGGLDVFPNDQTLKKINIINKYLINTQF